MRSLTSFALFGTALLGILVSSTPALAQDRPLDLPPQPVAPPAMAWPGRGPAQAWQGPNPGVRAAWLSECRRRQFAQDRDWDVDDQRYGKKRRHRENRVVERDPGYGIDFCEAYFDDYYATQAANAHPAFANGYPVQAMAPGCCQPTPLMMAPIRRAPECRETVTVEYIDAPVRARRVYRPAPRRALPDKRIRVVPDKRVRVN